MRNRLAWAGGGVLLLLGVAALLAPYLAPHPPDAVNPRMMFLPPGETHWFGTDDIGRDVFSRLLYAGRASLGLALGVAITSVAIGAVLGALAGYFGGPVDWAISALVDTTLSIPVLGLAMVAGAFIDLTPGRLVFILAAISWPTVARVVRAQILTLKAWPFVEAARAAGAPTARILFLHLLPHTTGPVTVAGTWLVAHAILIESALSFLGFGVPPPTATWGGMLHQAQLYFRDAPWLAVFPGLAITLSVAGINFLGEGLRERIDPRLGGAQN